MLMNSGVWEVEAGGRVAADSSQRVFYVPPQTHKTIFAVGE